jgi:hypothetical protein
MKRPTLFACLLLSVLLSGGCAVVAVADVVGTVAVKTVGVAADAAIGTVKIVGKGIGKVTDATLGDDKAAK